MAAVVRTVRPNRRVVIVRKAAVTGPRARAVQIAQPVPVPVPVEIAHPAAAGATAAETAVVRVMVAANAVKAGVPALVAVVSAPTA